MANPNRRTFFKGALISSAALSVPFSTRSRAAGANSDVRIAILGAGGKGGSHLQDISKMAASGRKGFRITGIADADANTVAQRKRDCEVLKIQADLQQDFRKLLDSKEVDAVVIATPNHWHSLMAVMAIQAGKHVYVEKPVSHNIWEGRMLAEHAKKNAGKLIVQHGMQRRSDTGWRSILEWMKNSPLGKPVVSRGLCYKLRENIGKVDGPQAPPEGLNYDLWSGPRDMEPIHRKRFHYDWHWQWPWGNGDIGNQGPHQLDVARWLIGDPTELPGSVLSIGGRFGYDDDATTANTQIAFFDTKPVPIIFEVYGLPYEKMNFKGRKPSLKGIDVGNIMHFEGGYVAESKAYDNDGKEVAKFKLDGGNDHMWNFINSVREMKQADTHSALTGHLSAGLAHLANISYRLGKATGEDECRERMKADSHALETFERMKEHLSMNGINLGEAKPTLGATLTFDGKAEKFTGELADEANGLMMEKYREPYIIPSV